MTVILNINCITNWEQDHQNIILKNHHYRSTYFSHKIPIWIKQSWYFCPTISDLIQLCLSLITIPHWSDGSGRVNQPAVNLVFERRVFLLQLSNSLLQEFYLCLKSQFVGMSPPQDRGEKDQNFSSPLHSSEFSKSKLQHWWPTIDFSPFLSQHPR